MFAAAGFSLVAGHHRKDISAAEARGCTAQSRPFQQTSGGPKPPGHVVRRDAVDAVVVEEPHEPQCRCALRNEAVPAPKRFSYGAGSSGGQRRAGDGSVECAAERSDATSSAAFFVSLAGDLRCRDRAAGHRCTRHRDRRRGQSTTAAGRATGTAARTAARRSTRRSPRSPPRLAPRS